MAGDTTLPARWINAHRFGARVLRAGEDPWSVPEQLGLYHKELQRWLSLALVDVDAEAAIVDFAARGQIACDGADDVVDLLDNGGLEDLLREGLASVTGGNPGVPVALSLPGSGRLVRLLTGSDAEDEDALDDVAVALTGLTRQIYTDALAGVLVHEDDARALEYYTPLQNVARHYQAPLWLALDADADNGIGDFAGAYDHRGDAGGRYLRAADWSEASAAADPAIYTHVPKSLSPDAVLAWLGALRTR